MKKVKVVYMLSKVHLFILIAALAGGNECAAMQQPNMLKGSKESFLATKEKPKQDNIWWAASKGNLASVVYWVKKNKDLANELDNRFGATALHWAAKRGHTEILNYLLDNGADINIEDKNKKTPLHWAPDENTVQLLINCGAQVDCKDVHGKTPLHWVTNQKIIPLLIQAGAQVDAKDNEGKNALQWAAGTGHQKVVQALIAAGTDINACDNQGRMALHSAVLSGQYAMIDFLVAQKNIKINGIDATKKRSALQWALRMCEGALSKKYKQNSIATTARIITLLIKKGADPKQVDRKKKDSYFWVQNLRCTDEKKNLLYIALQYNGLTQSHQKKFMNLLKDFE